MAAVRRVTTAAYIILLKSCDSSAVFLAVYAALSLSFSLRYFFSRLLLSFLNFCSAHSSISLFCSLIFWSYSKIFFFCRFFNFSSSSLLSMNASLTAVTSASSSSFLLFDSISLFLSFSFSISFSFKIKSALLCFTS